MKTRKAKTNVVAKLFGSAALVAFALTAIAGSLEPSAPPGPTMKTLDDIPPSWSQIIPASERFVLVLNAQAVLDKETGLVWAKNANLAQGGKTWEEAVAYCRNIEIGNRKGWRLPTVEELATLVDPANSSPPLPTGHPFDNVRSNFYWSSTTFESDTRFAWNVSMISGYVGTGGHYKTYDGFYVWPVRGGSGPALIAHTPSP